MWSQSDKAAAQTRIYCKQKILIMSSLCWQVDDKLQDLYASALMSHMLMVLCLDQWGYWSSGQKQSSCFVSSDSAIIHRIPPADLHLPPTFAASVRSCRGCVTPCMYVMWYTITSTVLNPYRQLSHLTAYVCQDLTIKSTLTKCLLF